MKNIVLLFICLVILSCKKEDASNLNNTDYKAFPDSEAYWLYRSYYNCSDTDAGCWMIYYIYKLENDTIINSIKYQKIYLTTIGRYKPSTDIVTDTLKIYPEKYDYSLIGFLRQSKNDKKIYFKALSNKPELLLYDFSLNVGDTLPFNSIFENQKISISSIDSINISNQKHKSYTIDLITGISQPYQLIEGIGSTRELVQPINEDHNSLLICFKSNETTFINYSTNAMLY